MRCPPQLALRRVLLAAPRRAWGASRQRVKRRRITVRVPLSVQRQLPPPRDAAARHSGKMAAVAATVASLVAAVVSGRERNDGAAPPTVASSHVSLLSRPAGTEALWEALDAANGECRRAARRRVRAHSSVRLGARTPLVARSEEAMHAARAARGAPAAAAAAAATEDIAASEDADAAADAGAHEAAAAAEEKRNVELAKGEFTLFTVIFCTNPANNLTCSPTLI